jgi:hypothetical protein
MPPSRSDLIAASRSSDRVAVSMTRPAKPSASAARLLSTRLMWTATRLRVWSRPSDRSTFLSVVDSRVKVRLTGVVRGRWAQIVWKSRPAWVHKAYLVGSNRAAVAADRRTAGLSGATAGASSARCPDGSAVEIGLRPNAVKVYRAVCAAFPAVSAWGGRSGSGGNHGAGLALDIMCSGSLGDAVARYLRSHASELGVSEVIWSQRIWTSKRSSEGWRAMSDRGSTTANHYDHVHVSVY